MSSFSQDYEEDRRPFSQSASVEIFRCTDRRTGKVCAAKVFNKRRLDHKRISNAMAEALLWKKLPPHPNLVQFLNVYDDPEKIHIAMEYMPRGTLYEQLITGGAMQEVRAGRIIAQVLQSLAHLHSCGVMHRDLKPENLFFRTKQPHDTADVVAIGDFGFATSEIPNEHCVGSPQYSAPELALIALHHHRSAGAKPFYNEKCDIWAVGVVAYVMLTGLLPFDGPTPTDVFTAVIRNQFPFELPACRPLSQLAKSFILAMTQSNPSKRPAAKDALRHAWIQQCVGARF